MNTALTRKRFLIGSGLTAASLFCGSRIQAQPGVSPAPAVPATPPSADEVPDFPEHDPQIDRARVKRFVIAAHSNLPAVKKMLGEDSNLINSTIDWGKGDFETALGGASHMGRRDIAEYLLEHNARLDIFAATMLGQIDIVKQPWPHSRTSCRCAGLMAFRSSCTRRKAVPLLRLCSNSCARSSSEARAQSSSSTGSPRRTVPSCRTLP